MIKGRKKKEDILFEQVVILMLLGLSFAFQRVQFAIFVTNRISCYALT